MCRLPALSCMAMGHWSTITCTHQTKGISHINIANMQVYIYFQKGRQLTPENMLQLTEWLECSGLYTSYMQSLLGKGEVRLWCVHVEVTEDEELDSGAYM